MSPPTTLTGIESSPSQMVPDGLPNIKLNSGILGSFDAYWDETTGSPMPSDRALDQYAKKLGFWAFFGGICLCFAIIILGLIGGVIT